MEPGIKRKIAVIERMTVSQMRQQYAAVFGEQTRSGNRQWLFRRIAWRLQSLDEGGLSERARRRAQELARDQDIRVIPPANLTMTPSGTPVRPISKASSCWAGCACRTTMTMAAILEETWTVRRSNN